MRRVTVEPAESSEATGVATGEATIGSASIQAVLDEGEIIILQMRPSILYIPLSCGTGLLIIALLAFLGAYVAKGIPAVGWTDRQALSAGVGLAALRAGWQALEWYTRLYVLTDRRILVRSGVTRLSIFQAPLRSIRHTTLFARVRERAFRLGTIGFATSGSESFDAFWVMIRRPVTVHRQVLEAIRKYGRGG